MVNNQLIINSYGNFDTDGYSIVRNLFTANEIQGLVDRITEISNGEHFMASRRFQLDTSDGDYDQVDMNSMDFKGPSDSYRKIADLEYDEFFLNTFKKKLFENACLSFYKEDFSIMRMTVMNKPALAGTYLPWHQDYSIDWPLSDLPLLTAWVPLDPISDSSGGLEIVKKSHKHGVIGRGHILPEKETFKYVLNEDVISPDVQPGDCLFFHPALLHRSGINRTNNPRRAINLVLLKAKTINLRTKKKYLMLFHDKS